MVRVNKEDIKETWKVVSKKSKTFRKNFVRDFIGVFGSLLLLLFISVAGVIFWVSDKFNTRKGKDTFLHR